VIVQDTFEDTPQIHRGPQVPALVKVARSEAGAVGHDPAAGDCTADPNGGIDRISGLFRNPSEYRPVIKQPST